MSRGTMILLAIPLLGWLLWKGFFPSVSWHQKLTISVEMPDGAKTGASVVYLKVSSQPKILPEGRPIDHSMRGEATVVDLGGGKYLFATLGSQQGLAYRVFGVGGHPMSAAQQVAGRKRSAEVPHEHVPLLVTFTDIADPASVKRVDPDDLDASFGLCPDGRGVSDADAPWRATGLTWAEWQRFRATGLSLAEYNERKMRSDSGGLGQWKTAFAALPKARDTAADCHRLTSITLEITDEPVTDGKVEQVLGWWSTYKDKQLDGDRYTYLYAENRFANSLSRLAFKRGQ